MVNKPVNLGIITIAVELAHVICLATPTGKLGNDLANGFWHPGRSAACPSVGTFPFSWVTIRAAIAALLGNQSGAGATLYAFLAHTVLVASAIAATRSARRPGARQLWRRHLLTGSSDGQANLISSAAPAWVVAG